VCATDAPCAMTGIPRIRPCRVLLFGRSRIDWDSPAARADVVERRALTRHWHRPTPGSSVLGTLTASLATGSTASPASVIFAALIGWGWRFGVTRVFRAAILIVAALLIA
jgi:hypothetical protein